MTAADMPTAFPFEGPEYPRPPRRRPPHLDDWELDQLAKLLNDEPTATTEEPAPPLFDPGDRIMRCVLAVWLACAVVFLLAAIGYHERGGPYYAGSIGVALTAAAIGSIAYRVTDRKAGRP